MNYKNIGEPIKTPFEKEVKTYRNRFSKISLIRFFLRRTLFAITALFLIYSIFFMIGLPFMAIVTSDIWSALICGARLFFIMTFFLLIMFLLMTTLLSFLASYSNDIKIGKEKLKIVTRFSPKGRSSEVEIRYDNIESIRKYDENDWNDKIKNSPIIFKLFSGIPKLYPEDFLSINVSGDNIIKIILKKPVQIYRMLPDDGFKPQKIQNYSISYIIFDVERENIEEILRLLNDMIR